MSTERRYSARHRVELPVYIRYGRRPFLGARARDLSVGGMFLSVQSLTLPVGTPIELELSCLGRDWLIPAVVVHGDNAGIGVMFREPQAALFQGLITSADMPPPIAAGAGAEAGYRR
ncbi:PilZ domain-containing protein [Thiohalocapsa sp.]|uniref:PilZ domain-containing protein n=1 Tax=Thiohalocapsa sp. TaxID=2497641 RepID=UPI0025FB5105|nr:PilZ domain-containing protein [Thiohalocapsa sp.]